VRTQGEDNRGTPYLWVPIDTLSFTLSTSALLLVSSASLGKKQQRSPPNKNEPSTLLY
jgi:hypothetical protein